MNRIIYLLVLAGFMSCVSGCAGKRTAFNPGPYYAPEKWVEVNGITTCYIEAGSGKVLLLVHGWAGNIYNWMSVFEPLAENHRVIALDLPGAGKSGCDPGGCYTTPCYARFLAGFMDALGLERASIVGSSMGGQVAAWFALLYPERTEALILVDAAGTSRQNTLMKLGATLITPHSVIPLIHTVFPVTEETLAAVPESERKRVELAEQLYASERRSCVSLAMSQSMKSVARDILDSRLAQIQAPTLIIWGADDPLLDVESGRIFQEGIPHAELVIIEQGSHTPMQWTPEEFIRVVEEFLARSVPNRR